MKDSLMLILKGVIIGIGKVIPGVSGSLIAWMLGLYEKGLYAISHFFYDVKCIKKFFFGFIRKSDKYIT